MNYLQNKLKEHGNICVGIVGLGIMGKSLLTTLNILEAFGPSIISARRKESLTEAFAIAKIPEDRYVLTNDIDKARIAIKENKYVGTLDNFIPATISDCLVDCTGVTDVGCQISLCAIKNKVNIVSLNVEMDATVGPYLKDLAKESGIVYSGTAGDEPGAIVDLYDFCKNCGFEVLVLGKGKNNALDNYATQDDLAQDAKRRGINKRMLTSFVDGTNTMIELNAVCNALGFLPDVRGCHFFHSTPKTLADDIKLKSQGGILNSYGVVDFVKGIAPGVFAIIKTKNEFIRKEMEYLSMGKGDNFAIYRPFHLTSLETPTSIMRAVLLGDSTISPKDKPYAETVAVAKRDIKKGEKFDSIGGYMVFGSLEDAKIQKKENHVPIGIITEGSYAKRDIKKDTVLTRDDIELNEDNIIVKTRREQEKIY
ncbi:NAD(P)-dependent oxidoreductase [Peptoniphilus lacrimalis DNF00528]|uniref:SAF domain protein n=1 Tax=Peptoniphilus lacrimalis 315-B TaxID=596330 RepID=D1VTV1_9FIRM|nr:SAF domain-containing protein [Peptoniphilus lacrimalis]EFA90063.1 SAF domain protein [Peptoniphilus lacrimalis 315-B]KGF36030.1 NAD(P)-dependent oxidoreductase [Peptoniphilus lacrimalis DNF00528]